MANDDLQLGTPVEDAVDDHAEKREGHTVRRSVENSGEEFSIFVVAFEDSTAGWARIDVNGHVKFCVCEPEDVLFRLVVEYVVLAIETAHLCIIYEGSEEFVLLNTAA